MSGLNLNIDLHDIGDLAQAWEQSPELVRRELVAATDEALSILEREIKEKTPVGVGGSAGLRGSITAYTPEVTPLGVLGVVGTSMAHALPVELGTRPHFPPIEPLITWLHASPKGQTLMNKVRASDPGATKYEIALAIARKIAARGTLAIGMFHRSFHQLQPQISDMYERANQRIVDGLTRG
ncbi:MAG: hypothetical protein JMN25_15770 [gamma proteobacterium endosymbiont of Lamellibrachia anaximandri]|nr:hypothetical protein [gamma proteobacterium endosymbiont of Lamellibrachia anaximandri]